VGIFSCVGVSLGFHWGVIGVSLGFHWYQLPEKDMLCLKRMILTEDDFMGKNEREQLSGKII